MTTSRPESENSVSLDAVLSAVANDHRRAILRTLHHTDGNGMGVSALTDEVAEQVRTGEPRDDTHRQRVRVALHHTHLPKLEACEMIVCDTETEQVWNVTGELSQELLALIAPHEVHETQSPSGTSLVE